MGQMGNLNKGAHETLRHSVKDNMERICISKLQPTRYVSWFIYFYRHSTCFRRFLHPSSGAQNCTYSFRYCQPVLQNWVPSHPR